MLGMAYIALPGILLKGISTIAKGIFKYRNWIYNGSKITKKFLSDNKIIKDNKISKKNKPNLVDLDMLLQIIPELNENLENYMIILFNAAKQKFPTIPLPIIYRNKLSNQTFINSTISLIMKKILFN